MSVTPDLEMKRLEGIDRELAMSLAASVHGIDDPRSECFGLAPDGAPEKGGDGWGVYIRGGLAGALWFAAPEITAVALPKGRWGMGLLLFMAGELARTAPDGLVVRLAGGGPGLGEALADAGFSGPDPEDESYPAGDWVRS